MLGYFPKLNKKERVVDKNGNKDFKGWLKLKTKLHYLGHPIDISEGDVWWCATGENIQTEINGKSDRFSRPVLVVKKFGRYSFWGVPLTTKEHDGSWYVPFEFRNRLEVAAIHQMRNMDVSRLYDKIGQVPNSDLELVRSRIVKLLIEIPE